MFWNTEYTPSPHIDNLLSKEDVKVEELLDDDEILQEYTYSRDDCRAHRLNTILQNTFDSDDIPLIITKIMKISKKIVRHLKQSGKTNYLAKAVVQQCETRWKTNLGMLESVIGQYDRIKELLTIEQRENWYINTELAAEIIRFLKPFKEATESLEAENSPTACKILLWWEHLSEHLKEENFNDPPIKSLVRTAKAFFNLKYQINMDNKIACFLDPRYRFLKMLPENERNELYTEIKRLLQELPQIDQSDLPPAKKADFQNLKNILLCLQVMMNLNFICRTRTTQNIPILKRIRNIWSNYFGRITKKNYQDCSDWRRKDYTFPLPVQRAK